MLDALTNALVLLLLGHPIAASLLWTTHGLISLFGSRRAAAPTGPAPMTYSVVIPFHDEPEGALATAWSLAAVRPRPRRIVLVDDGSARGMPTDTALPPRTRLLRLDRNGGKARALNTALRTIEADVVVCLDADAQVVTQDWRAMLARFRDPALGAVSGAIWPAAPRGLTQRLQQLDYVSVIGLIKSAETTWGALMTVSGACAAFRRQALESIGGWREDTATEDIDASWRLQSAGWRLEYDRQWVAQVEMVPHLPGLWRQRRRWSMGMGRALRDEMLAAWRPGARQLPVAVLSSLNLLWVVLTLGAAAALAGAALAGALPGGAGPFADGGLLAGYLGGSLLVFGAQFLCAAALDGRPWRTYAVLVLLAPLYPLYFWTILYTSYLAGFPRGLLRGDQGRWRRSQRLQDAVREGADA